MNDNELLERLAAAFAPPPTEPPAASIANLRAEVAAFPAPAQPRWRPAWRPRWAIPALSAVLLVGGTSTAYAVSGWHVPDPVRRAAHAIGLPVDTPELANAHDQQAALRDALRRGDPTAVSTAATLLRARLANLDSDDRRALEPEADALLAQADALVTTTGDDDNDDAATQDHQSPTTTRNPTDTSPADDSVPVTNDEPSSTEPPTSPDDGPNATPTTTAPDTEPAGDTSS